MNYFIRTRNDGKERNRNGKATSRLCYGNKPNGTLYVGVTSDFVQRVAQHKAATIPSFTARHACTQLAWFELQGTMEAAILREKQLKGGSRQAKIALIVAHNPDWRDFYPDLV